MSFAGRYINLDRSPDRRQAMEAMLGTFGLTGLYTRFAAVDSQHVQSASKAMRDTEYACLLSHRQVLAHHAANPVHLHIVEDDAVFCARTRGTVEMLAGTGQLNDYDIVFLDIGLAPQAETLRHLFGLYAALMQESQAGQGPGVRLFPMGALGFSACCSYLVNARSIGKLTSLYDRLDRLGRLAAVDLLIRQAGLHGILRLGLVFPFITSISLDLSAASTIGGRHDARSSLVTRIARHSFFVAADHAACQRALRDCIGRSGDGSHIPRATLHGQVLDDVLTFAASDEYVRY